MWFNGGGGGGGGGGVCDNLSLLPRVSGEVESLLCIYGTESLLLHTNVYRYECTFVSGCLYIRIHFVGTSHLSAIASC